MSFQKFYGAQLNTPRSKWKQWMPDLAKKKKKIETPDLTISRSNWLSQRSCLFNWLSQRSCDLREILDMCTSLHSTTTRQRTVYSYNAFEAWYKKNGRVDTCLFTRTNMYISLVSRRKQEKQNNDPVASLLSKQTSVISLSLSLSLSLSPSPSLQFFFFLSKTQTWQYGSISWL